MYSVVIKNASIIDGTGSQPRHGDIAIEGEQIVRIADSIDTAGQTVIDAQGLVVCPGFIDVQNHSDSYWQLFDNPSLDSLRAQGFTTIVVGHCGASLAPLLSRESLSAMQKWHSLEGANVNWSSFSEFIETLQMSELGCNVASLVGYSTLRRGLVGGNANALQTQESKTLLAFLEQSLAQGAFGLSNGLGYGHELSVTPIELKDFVEAVAKTKGLFSVHLRNEDENIIESLDEVLELAKDTGVKLKISHLKLSGGQDKHVLEHVIDRLETARHQGVDVWFDVYPYDTVWQNITRYLPSWIRIGGRNHILSELKDPTKRKKVIEHLHNTNSTLPELLVVSTANKLNVIGKRLSHIAKDFEITSEEALLLLIEHGGTEIMVFDQTLDSKTVESLVMHPFSLVATDGAGFPNPQGVTSGVVNDRLVHPRCFGTAPKFLADVRDTNAISLSEAIRKLTSTAAQVVGITDRGELAVGKKADIVIFNPSTIVDTATLTSPYRFPRGIEHVLINGQLTVKSGITLKTLSGQVLRKRQT
ncbi:MAG: amidohydrolase family protein [Candidatus Doudnabacteria bacterium]|nr:amidohydrolase family protein [Candidatus Doudnabacteria bacterium]